MYCDVCPKRVPCLVEIRNRKICMSLHEHFFTLVAEFLRRVGDEPGIIDMRLTDYRVPAEDHEVILKVGIEMLEDTLGFWHPEERVVVIEKSHKGSEKEKETFLW